MIIIGISSIEFLFLSAWAIIGILSGGLIFYLGVKQYEAFSSHLEDIDSESHDIEESLAEKRP